jgi:hypothetical protein
VRSSQPWHPILLISFEMEMDTPSCMSKVIQNILSAKSIYVIIGENETICFEPYADNMAGAGVSVAAGIPPFRGDGGIHVEKLNRNTIKDLMSIGVMQACLSYLSDLRCH